MVWQPIRRKTHFDIAKHIVLYGSEGYGAHDVLGARQYEAHGRLAYAWPTKETAKGLGCFEEICGDDGIVFAAVNWHVREGLFEGLKECGSPHLGELLE